MRRNELVHTPAGWAVFDGYEYHETPGTNGWPTVETLARVIIEAPDGTDDPVPRLYRLEELEPIAAFVERFPAP